jgi:DNA-binding response OmpR family regulator
VKILLVEDDELVAEVLSKALTTQHYLVDLATDGQAGVELAEAFEYDLILLDLLLPKLDGISFCKQRRQAGDRTPILLLTAQDTSTNKVAGLDAGADDYMVKPFDLHELLARIRALLRRGTSVTMPVLEWGNLRLDPSSCEVSYAGQLLSVTPKEYSLLELFLRNTQRIFSQSALLDHLWSFEESPLENTVRAHIKSLRQKLKKAGAAADLIETVYGLGYRLKLREPEARSGEAETTVAPAPASPLATSAEPTKPQIISELTTDLWERFKDKYSDRVNIVEQAVIALQQDTLSEELRQQALAEAHTLVGSLGSFGFTLASDLSREIEQMFQVEARLNQAQKQQLSELVMRLRQELGQASGILATRQDDGVALMAQLTPIEQQPRLLVVDDDAPLALALTSGATAWGMQAEVATSLAQARKAIALTRPDVVLLDLCFPDSTESGFELLAELTTYIPPVPVVVFTAHESFADRVKVARMGGRGFLQKPVSPDQVWQAIAQVLQQSSTPEAKLLIVDDDLQLLDFLRTLLEPWGFNLTLLNDPQQFWNTLEQFVPDLLILDVEMPDLSGIDLCQVVRNDPRWSDLPVLFLSARTDSQTVHQVFTAGADDYVNKPIVGPELVARVLNRLERTKIRRNWHKIRLSTAGR